MIRMGRGSRNESPEETPAYPASSSAYPASTQAPAQSYSSTPEPATGGYPVETAAASRPVTESENMARDIKDGRLSGFVGHGTTLKGETNFQAMLRVDGHLIGTIMSDSGTLIIGTNGQVDANISVAVATVNGTVNGDIIASEKIELGRTARVVGNIQTPRLTIEDGALLEGGCTMVKAREAKDKPAKAAPAASATAPSASSAAASSGTSSPASSSNSSSAPSSTSSSPSAASTAAPTAKPADTLASSASRPAAASGSSQTGSSAAS